MKVVEIVRGSVAFAAVLRLWRGESSTLGFMPEGGFDDAARLGCLVGAYDDSSQLVGYAMFRRSSQKVAAITHLCVATSHRGKGVARLLFDAVKQACGDCFEIRLRCRRDFAASGLWPKLGFVPVKDMPGKSRDGIITIWRYEIAPLPLFRKIQHASEIARVAIDANVFFDLDELSDGEEESRSLAADWLGEFVELMVTQELYNEINRRKDDQDRQRQRERASRFSEISRDVGREEVVLERIKEILGTSETSSSQSDARQVAMTIAGDVPFFVTRDGGVLQASDALDDEFGIQVLSPHEIIRRFDELRREDDYRPRRLFFGGGASASFVRADEIEQLVELLHGGQEISEPRRRTVGHLRELLAAPERYEAMGVRRDGSLVAAYVIDRSVPDQLVVPFFAVAPSPLGRTAARHYGDSFVVTASREGRRVVRVERPGPRACEALDALGFSEENDAWVKLTLPLARSVDAVAAEVERVATFGPPAEKLANRLATELRGLARGPSIARVQAVDVERALWPAKITSTELPSFVVPIQPRWAKELFDRELAASTLFGADPRLVLNSENVYYRSARPEIISAPSRVLWYVSDDSAYPQSKAIRACSYVDEVVIGPPKDLFRRFKRLGVYEWSDVFAIARGDVNREIMAFQFSKTELFGHPISWNALQKIFKTQTGKGSQLQSPVAISESCFFEIYRLGVSADAA